MLKQTVISALERPEFVLFIKEDEEMFKKWFNMVMALSVLIILLGVCSSSNSSKEPPNQLNSTNVMNPLLKYEG